MADQDLPAMLPVNGTELAYIQRGSGAPLVFVHGSLGDYRSWGRQLDAFAQKYRVVSYSRRYHYPNPWTGSGTDYTVSLHANDLIGLVEALGLGPVYAVGNSFGAYTTLLAALRRPDLFRKVVLGEPPILPWLKEIPGGDAYWDEFMNGTWLPAARAFGQGNLEEGVRSFIGGVSGVRGAFDQMPQTARESMLANARTLSAETASPDYFTEITPEQVEKMDLPVLMPRGARSPKMFHLVLDRLAQHVRRGQPVTIPDSSHSMPSNNPPVYNQVVLDFLG